MEKQQFRNHLTGTWKRYMLFMVLFALFCSYGTMAWAQGNTISGKVTDADTEEPLIGVTVSVKGTTQGTMTDLSGNYTINAAGGSTLEFKLIGYETVSVPIGNRTQVNIALKTQSYQIDDVVVIGYGTVKKSDLTGAVGSISAKQIQDVTVTNPQLALQGRVPGVQVTQTDFSPSGGVEIRIRGTRSFQASNDPLYVVDGMMMSTQLNFLDPSDIESIDILKDASATAIYGSRGANGVVIITTKRGKEGRTQVEYNSYIGFQKIGRKLDMMNAAEWIEYVREAHRQATASTKYHSPVPNMEEDMNMVRFNQDEYVLRTVMMGWNADGTYWDPNKVQGFDWIDAVTKDGFTQNHNINVRGGSAKTQYSFGATYTNTDGVVKNRGFERLTARSAIDTQISSRIKAGLTFQYSHSKEDLDIGLYSAASSMWPASFPIGDDGNYIPLPGNETTNYNVLLDLVDEAAIKERKRDRLLANVYLDAKIIDGLSFRTSFSYDYDMLIDGNFYASKTRANKGGDNTTGVANERAYSYTLDNVLTYTKTFAKVHNLTVTAVQSIEGSQREKSSIDAKGIPIDSQKWFNLSSAGEITSVKSDFSEKRLASFLGRAQYGFNDRYLLTASLRYDGASVLADGHKWVAFPSAAFAWRVIEEPFMANTKGWVSNLKLRVGWGRTGNSSVSPYKTQGLLSDTKYVFGDSNNSIGFRPSELANKELGWEYTNQTNLGLDFGFLNGRISGSIDVYQQRTNSLLMNRQLPVALGYGSILFNIGKTQNKGLEIGLNTVNVASKQGFHWTTDWVFSMNREKIVELYNGKKDDVGNSWFIGEPIKVYYGYKYDRIWSNTEEDLALMEIWNEAGNTNLVPGTIKLVDRNGDNKIDPNDDRMIIGNPRPKFTASLMNNLAYKGIDLSFLIYVDYGRTIENTAPMTFNGRDNLPRYDYWTPNNPNARYPQPYYNSLSPTNEYMGTLKYENGSFLRMREITLGYTLPTILTRKAFVERCRVYAAVQNPFIITNFSGVDPEATHGTGYPMVRTFLFGLNLSF